MIAQVPGNNIDIQRWIRWMDAEVFPDDKPVTFNGSTWFIAWNGDVAFGTEPMGYAAWRPHYPMETVGELHWPEPQGFLYRAGVLKKYRGRGLQKQLIERRESSMRAAGIKVAVTYTDPVSAASMRSLISCGYRPFEPTPKENLAGVGRAAGFVHWKKDL
jgi:GNAT superfamily N-acetyltransferase